MKNVVLIVLTVLLLGTAFLVRGWHLGQEMYYAPKEENVRHEVYKNSAAYSDGMIQELSNMQLEYIKADADGKAAMKSIILHRAAAFDLDRCPADLRMFINGLKGPER